MLDSRNREHTICYLIGQLVSDILILICEFETSVVVAWSVDSLPSNPAARVRFPAGSGILISVLGLGVCP